MTQLGFARVAWLEFAPWAAPWRAGERKLSGGAKMLREVLESSGHITDTVTVDGIDAYDVILVSLTSEADCLAFRRAVLACPDWRRGNRRATVIAGGFGVQNPYAISDLVDVAYWGRAEDEIVELVEDALSGRHEFSSQHMMRMADGVTDVVVRQPTTLFDGHFTEEFVGCPLSCKFCHYTFARKHLGGDGAFATAADGKQSAQYLSTMYGDHGEGSSTVAEVSWPLLTDWPAHLGWRPYVKVGLDGPSERLRWLYGKRISRDQVADGMQAVIDRLDAQRDSSGVALSIYDIGFPAETAEDREELHDVVMSLREPRHARMTLTIHLTPFKPSSWTPMAWEPFEMRNLRDAHRGEYLRQDNIWAKYDGYIQSPKAQVAEAVATRADDSAIMRRAINGIANSGDLPRWRAGMDARAHAEDLWGRDAARYLLDEHDVGTRLPADRARGKADIDSLARIARRMRAEADRSAVDPSFRRGVRDVAGTPVLLGATQ